MKSRPTEPAGKPFLRVPLTDKADPKNSKPVTKPGPTRMKKKASPTHAEYAAIERGNREQAREAGSLKMLKKGIPMKKFAKGGSVDGCATKGKTKTKMVKMAMGGMARPTLAGGSGLRGGPAHVQMPMMAKGGKTKTKKMAMGGMARPTLAGGSGLQGGPAHVQMPMMAKGGKTKTKKMAMGGKARGKSC